MGKRATLQPLTDIQKVKQWLVANKDFMLGVEEEDYEQLETNAGVFEGNVNDDSVCLQKVSELPTLTEADVISLREKEQLSATTSSKAGTKTEEEEENDDKKVVKSRSVLPETFSLRAPINVPYDTTAHGILSMSAERILKLADFKPIFDEEVRAPSPPLPPKVEDEIVQNRAKLLPPTPLLLVESRRDASSLELQRYCENAPIALVRGLPSALEIDLSHFSTDTIKKKAGSITIPTRLQSRMSPDINFDFLRRPKWKCRSLAAKETILSYAIYQAEERAVEPKEKNKHLRHAGSKYAQQTSEAHGGKRQKVSNADETEVPEEDIRFGTNVDLSNKKKWKRQLHEISKMPPFCRILADGNMLSHLGHQVYGMNTVELYMKVAGSRTPAHQENNSFASININIGPGDCVWFAVPYEYWGVIEKLCRKHNIDYLRESYWPNLDELLAENVPVYRFTQKPGDLVWVGYGCVHWVQAVGACNNIAWNVGPMNSNQLSISIRSYEWNRLKKFKSLIPMQHLAWQLAKNIKPLDESMYTLIRGLLIRSLSFCKIVVDYATANGKQLKPHSRLEGEVPHYCTACEIEVFNFLFVKKVRGKGPVYCVYCSQQQGLDKFDVLQQFEMSELAKIYDDMVLNQAPKIALTA